MREKQEMQAFEYSPKILGKRKISKSENRAETLEDSPYENRYRKKVNKVLKDLTDKRMDRQDRFYSSVHKKSYRKLRIKSVVKNNYNSAFKKKKKSRCDDTRMSKSEDNRSRHSSI
jgi:hypothetical protein